ncbi:MAG: CBS domain-containing protein [Ruminococcus sp.]|nr:CBS domain-containing protein [uncultured Ruminococcus sp.]MBQ1350070.1 CBS domain-containing protein [Ruminococcus sp.]SCX01750.1 CBS domain-containing protein [Ruminococcaceae bacterium P7]MBQ2469686.1 CBS domain-containing protein [Ruminococcus sp.]MBQ4169987.1 CBS domain-containing protein [Ruminococcus sp.]MBQ4262571.1 CBS domain-containing protein [Ruminococcus sp.]
MNVIMLLKPKTTVQYIFEDNTLRQGLEKMRAHSYTAIPVISQDGKYVGTVSEGDFLYYILDQRNNSLKAKEKHLVRDILREGFNPAVRIDVTMDELLERAMRQNFVPVTDDFDTFIGIVTRQDIIRNFIE